MCGAGHRHNLLYSRAGDCLMTKHGLLGCDLSSVYYGPISRSFAAQLVGIPFSPAKPVIEKTPIIPRSEHTEPKASWAPFSSSTLHVGEQNAARCSRRSQATDRATAESLSELQSSLPHQSSLAFQVLDMLAAPYKHIAHHQRSKACQSHGETLQAGTR